MAQIMQKRRQLLQAVGASFSACRGDCAMWLQAENKDICLARAHPSRFLPIGIAANAGPAIIFNCARYNWHSAMTSCRATRSRRGVDGFYFKEG